MDVPLNKYKTRINEITENVSTNNFTLITATQIDGYLDEVATMRQYLEDLVKLARNAHSLLIQKKNIVNTLSQQDIQTVIYTDDAVVADEYQMNDRVVVVDDLDDVPETPIYFIKNIKQYGINLGGLVLRGTIGNIYNSVTVSRNNLVPNLVYCKYKNLCKKILSGKSCKYYHDPLELRQLYLSGILDKYTFEALIGRRNYINTSWIYTEFPDKPSNKNMRHFGSYNTLNQYLRYCKIGGEESSRIRDLCRNYKDQCMHDLLVMYTMHTNDLDKNLD